MKKHFYLFLIIILAFSCTEKQDPTNSEYPNGILVKTEPEIRDGDWVGWIVIHSQDGTYTEMREITRGGSADFRSLKEDFYHLTLFIKSINTNGNEAFSGSTLLDVPVGKKYTIGLKFAKYDTPDISGEFNISIKRGLNLSGFYSSSSNGILSNSSSFFPDFVEIKQGIGENSNGYLAVAYDNSGEFRYKYLTDVSNQDNYELDFAEMNPFDKTLSVPKSYGGVFNVSSLVDDGQEYRIGHVLTSSRFGNISPNTVYKIGFLKNIELYRTDVGYSIGKHTYSYSKVGSAPSSIDFPEVPNLENGNFDPLNFHFLLPAWATSYQVVYNSIFKENGVSEEFVHSIVGDSENFSLKFPNELLSIIPHLGRKGLYDESIHVGVKKTSFTYQEEIQNILVSRPSRFEFETYQIGQRLR